MSDKLSEEELNKSREFYGKNPKYWFPHRLIAEIDRLRAENKELREIVRECRELLDEVVAADWHYTEWNEYDDKVCISECRGCAKVDLLTRIRAAIGEGK